MRLDIEFESDDQASVDETLPVVKGLLFAVIHNLEDGLRSGLLRDPNGATRGSYSLIEGETRAVG